MPLDQDVLQWGLRYFLQREHNITRCSFPADAFAGECGEPYIQKLSRRGLRKINRCALVSYHATCLLNASSKQARLEQVLCEVERRCAAKPRPGGHARSCRNAERLAEERRPQR